ncbi:MULTISPECIES: aminotransferase [unclassified Bacillus cereus group]|uniref:aminotransferase n=1 Tax=unclassified Bacillus cereus group TaxID=2750818 RepID=UPI001F59E68C
MKIDLSTNILNGMKQYIDSENMLLALVYGSQSWNHFNKKNSDIDMMFIVKKEQPKMKQQLIADFMKLNRSLNYELDTEVPYENKLVISLNDIVKALEGLAFQKNNTLCIQPILKTETFLNSNTIKYRLILSAFTTNPLLLSGEVELFVSITQLAFLVVLKVIITHYKCECFTIQDLLEKILTNGIHSGEDYLGYKSNPIQIESYRVFLTEQLNLLAIKEIARFKHGIYYIHSEKFQNYYCTKLSNFKKIVRTMDKVPYIDTSVR